VLGSLGENYTRQPAIRVVLLPRDTNGHGTIFGGIILSYIDLAGGVEAARHTKNKLVTVAMKEVDFKAPVLVGEVVSFYTNTIRVGRTSISVHVDVEVERTGKPVSVTHADMTFVSVDGEGKPKPLKNV
jgi:acyl-CoA thioesterase YciA